MRELLIGSPNWYYNMTKKLNPLIQNLLILSLYILGLYVALNWGYVWKNLDYSLNPPGDTASVPVRMDEPNRIWIPSLDIAAPIVESKASNEQAFQEALGEGVVHYPGTAQPGQQGNVYLFGHSSDFPNKPGNYKTVFALLPRIKIGAEILVSDDKGQVFKYVAFETKVIKPTEVGYVKPELKPGEKMLTVQTSYPVGTALRRFIVLATLQNE